jgi:hypothetical protein
VLRVRKLISDEKEGTFNLEDIRETSIDEMIEI